MTSRLFNSMVLKDEYYSLLDIKEEGQKGQFVVSINKYSKIFLGHFPDNPICPGVCNIEMIRECVSMLTGRDLRITKIKNCRFTSVARPISNAEFTIYIELTHSSNIYYDLFATITDKEKNYLTLNACCKAIEL